MFKIVIIISTRGAVLNKLLEVNSFRDKVHAVISDRECGAIEIASKFKIPTMILESKSGGEFSEKLVGLYENKNIDLFVSFYTRLFNSHFVSFCDGKLINLHPSILPACPGQNGFGDTLASGAKFIGSTVHFIDNGIDTGKPIIQAALPYNPEQTIEEKRHKIFIQQCKMLLQVIEWFSDERFNDDATYSYNISEFSPNLESEEAKKLFD